MKTKSEQIIELYTATNKLKTVLRQGWLNYELQDVRIESIAEHVFGTCMLAISIFANSASANNVDLQKLVLMLSLHEMEEIIIGDLTPFDVEKNKTKKIDGKNAVEKLFKDCKYY